MKIKRFLQIVAGSIFVQMFFWALYSKLELGTGLCGISALAAAMLYHYLQAEEQTGLSRRNVFFAAVLTPFAAALAITVTQFVRHPNLTLLRADLDGVSPMTELVALYAMRLAINGAVLVVFAAVDALWLRGKAQKEPAHEG